MKDLFFKLMILSIVVVMLSGCAAKGVSNDTTQTKRGGALAGALLGGLVGGAIGFLDNGVEGMVAGAAIGGIGGAAAGYVAGSEVAERKQEYANDEDQLDNEIAAVGEYNTQLTAINKKTEERIATLGQEIVMLKTLTLEETVRIEDLNVKRDEINVIMEDNTNTKVSMNEELWALIDYQNSLDQTQNQIKLDQLKQEIDALQENLAMLDTSNQQMAQLIESINISL